MLATLALLAATATCPDVQLVPHDGALRFTSVDVEASGPDGLALRRALSTNLPFSGEFGEGFAIEEELTVEPLAGGALRVTVPGPCPACAAAVAEPSPEALAASVAEAAETLRASGASALAGEALALARALGDPAYREAEWTRQQAAWLEAARAETAAGVARLPLGARYRVVALPSGYLRYAGAGEVQELDASGRLVRVVDAAGLVRAVVRDRAGRIVRIEDRRGRAIALEHDAAGHVVRASATGGAEATYGYDDRGRMRWSRAGDCRVEYGWTDDGALATLREGDREVKATYEPRASGGRVLTLDRGGGDVERYAYEGGAGGFMRGLAVYRDEAAPDAAAEDDGEPREASLVPGPEPVRRYAWIEPLGRDGRRWTWQQTVEEYGDVRVTVYDDRWFQPLAITEGDRTARFEYDARGRLVAKAADGQLATLAYDAASGKVARVDVRDEDAPPAAPPRESVALTYDARGRLERAEGAGRTATVEWDAAGRIAVLAVQRDGDPPHRLRFDYGADERTTRVEVDGAGALELRHGPGGEVERVDPSADRAASAQMSAVVQDLLDLLRPASPRLDL